MSLKIGDQATHFSLQDKNGDYVSLDDLTGKTTLIYFYPKDDTPGCTAQACSLRDNIEDLKTNGIDVIGVSKDEVDSHAKFASKYKIPFTILSDPSTKMIEAYGAWGERNMYGKKFMGTIRSGVLIGPDLKILAIWPKLQPLKTVSEVEKFINA
ncbi:MAG TPA: thioredoxin-dependent thiol peroxidase [Candidatus Saccharibacteria bacterium]|nr:thioredoxin-dependent thiol peroxidase [Candidatus Saccharibacteria bacterium]HMT39504.1 thioredoxin-dependent thiol peroxidase [Candidatus Saccharibacteria bacterium]